MHLSDFKFTALTADIPLSQFECGEDEISNFLIEDALFYQTERMANTYLFLKDDLTIVAYFSISNDCLIDWGEDFKFTNTDFNRLHRKASIPNSKRIRQYPAVKVGRLGVASKYQGSGLAYELMDFIKGFSTFNQNPACRLLLLDALNKERQLKYYKNNGFEHFLLNDIEDKTRIMYYDLEKIS
ncbi:GNAT family N-acetyltransferase [Mucilaginibacter flavus]|uniref:GNAT family N-acetyltransferase n=1 Tax=Mucilaginibacter flavus TaxID=931504 RepID=UPI0025B49D06|nr:hypothetical protein [Mucilaginibacter flavus]MDN3582797.1 hypothetical protein [Mucilaginibacter flavus]